MLFDRSKLDIKPLDKRIHDLTVENIRSLSVAPTLDESVNEIASQIIAAQNDSKEIIMMIGGHVVRAGVQNYLIDLMERGYITHLAMNGACVIHDFEFALIGATTESVPRYIKEGQFGLWQETGRINDIVNAAYAQGGCGMGQAIGKAIYEGDFPYKNISLLAACYRLNIPATVHISIGADIIHEHPNFDGAAAGATSYIDFLKFTDTVSRLENGIIMNFGSAVMAPEVYLKALSMARNVAHQEGMLIKHFTTVVCDLHELPDDFKTEAPKNSAGYYFRPWKTMLVRTVADGGRSFYIKGAHAETIPGIWTAIRELGLTK